MLHQKMEGYLRKVEGMVSVQTYLCRVLRRREGKMFRAFLGLSSNSLNMVNTYFNHDNKRRDYKAA